jgi:alkylation response protein AidB-like acyl-CoA dehydrogenase
VANHFHDNDDLRFYFEKGIDWAPLVELTEHGYRTQDGFKSSAEAVQFYRQVTEMVGQFVAEEIAPHVAEIDREAVLFRDGEASFPPRLAGIFEKIRGLELHGMCLPRELGGMNCPLLLYLINAELFARADASVMAHHSFHGGMAMAMLVFSILEGTTTYDAATARITSTRFQKEIEEIVRGEAWGCMDITEPDAGSDMAALRAVGEQDSAGRWFVSGQKIFITSGHGKYHFVIARTEKPGNPDDPFAGLGGLSMFLVPTYEEDASGRRRIVSLDRIEEKLGHHGSVTASLTFERAPAHLIGKRGEGFKHMLTLMNNARLGVGFESLGVCEAAHRLARAYAALRSSMGKTIDRHEMIADYLDEMRADIQGLRALAMYGAIHEELGHKISLFGEHVSVPGSVESKRRERAAREHRRKARRVTPLLKYLAAEKAVEMARRCVQIHGGNGYIREYGAEKLLRDAMVMPIYEGTSQIQALMAMKDTLQGILRGPQELVKRLAQTRWRSLSARDPLERRVADIQVLSLSAQNHLLTRTAADKLKSLGDKPLGEWPRAFAKNWDPKRDFALAMLHAERLTRLLADEAICEILYAQAREHPERRELCERYVERAEPRCRALRNEITTTGRRLLRQLEEARERTQRAAG